MGLLRTAMRGARGFMDGASDAMRWHAPMGNAAIGAIPGAMIGASTDSQNPLRGALAGGAIGAGILGGSSALNVARSGLRGAASEMSAAREIAAGIRNTAQRDGRPGVVEAYVEQLRMQDPGLADDVMQILMRGE